MHGTADNAPVPHVRIQRLTKRFGGTLALNQISLDIARGQIHALVGENGAGKSTLGKILAGAAVRDGGDILLDGSPVRYGNPREALADGLALVHQEISLVPSLSVLENVFLGAESARYGVLRRRTLRRRLDVLNEETGFGLSADKTVSSLRVAEQQKVEVLRALAREAQLIVFDEPTAALSIDEAERLYAVLRALRERGTTIVYVSHFLEEVLALADTVTVLRNGEHIRTASSAEEGVESLILAILGRPLDSTFPPKAPVPGDAPVVLKVDRLSRRGAVQPASLELRAGEIVGIAGLVGSGRSELARLICGADRADSGTVEIAGRRVRLSSPRSAIESGIAYLSEDRKQQGLLPSRSVRENLSLATLGRMATGGVLRRAKERDATNDLVRMLDIRPARGDVLISTLSGGNQQKAMLGRWVLRNPKVLIADEPTRGVDVGAKSAIYELLHELAFNRRMGVVLISSDLEEIKGMSHRVVVIHRGQLVGELSGDASEAEILAAVFGSSKEEMI